MKIEEISERYPVLEDAVKQIKEIDGIEKLYPPQKEAIEKGVLEKNAVLSFPTASGKTLISELAMVRSILRDRGKSIYIVPLKALANEKYSEFKEKYSPIGIKVARSTGDFDSRDPWLKRYDIIVSTSEKTDSLIRHEAPWLNDVQVVVADEVHLINSPTRGPTLEVTLTRLRELNPALNFLLLSASLSNAEDLAKWIDGILIESDFRPVQLYEGIFYDGKIMFEEKEDYNFTHQKKRPVLTIARDTIRKKEKQAIVFVSTRRSAEAVARRLTSVTKHFLKNREKKKLKTVAKRLYNALDNPTKQCKKISRYVAQGAAFHHAGLSGTQKELIENNFRKGLIKFVAATPSLAMGVDLPAFRVILRDTKRYAGGKGMQWIPTLEFEQMSGRAGRPQYDSYGEAILIAKSEDKISKLRGRYIKSEPEAIDSKLAVEPVLRMYVLTVICEGYDTESRLTDFFAKTFYGQLYGDIEDLMGQLKRVIHQLKRYGFIEIDRRYFIPTKIGERVSELYIDPLTVYNLMGFLKDAERKEFSTLMYLVAISDTVEMEPLPSVRKSERNKVNRMMSKRREELFHVSMERSSHYRLQKAFKMALILNAWIQERGEDTIYARYNLTPGGLFAKLSIAEWLLYACSELCPLLGLKKTKKRVEKLRTRVKHGVQEELLDLVDIRGIGRVRARTLYEEGIKTVEELRKAPIHKIKKLLGPKLGEKIKKRVQ